MLVFFDSAQSNRLSFRRILDRVGEQIDENPYKRVHIDRDFITYRSVLDHQTLSSGKVFEGGFERNNATANAPPSIFELPPPADIQVDAIDFSGVGASGDSIHVEWTVANHSSNPTASGWTDAVYLSDDNVWDIGDRLLGRVAHSGVLAENERIAFDESPVPPGTLQTQRAALDVRAAHLLEAQRLYFDTMRWSEPYWTSAAGYQIGSLYDRFFQSIVTAPVPPASEPLTQEERADYEQTYRDALAQYVEPLLRHSIRYWELTLQMIERTGVDTEWRARIEADLARVRQQLGALLGS